MTYPPHKPKTGSNTAWNEWCRKTQSSVYIKKAAKMSRFIKGYLSQSRVIDKRLLPLPIRAEFIDTLHNMLDPFSFEERRRERKSKEETPPAIADMVSTTSLPY